MIWLAEVTVENRHGDPRYLEVARKALADVRKVWGLDAPREIDIQALHVKRLTLFGVSNKMRTPEQRAAGVPDMQGSGRVG